MYPVIEQAERAVLEEKIRTVFGAGAATTALLKIIDAVNKGQAVPEQIVNSMSQDELESLDRVEAGLQAVLDAVAPEVQVVESSP